MEYATVEAHLLRVDDPLTLSHRPSYPTAGYADLGSWPPAMLVIPRICGPRDPHVVVLDTSFSPWPPTGMRRGRSSEFPVSARVDVRVAVHAGRPTDLIVPPGVLLCRSGRTGVRPARRMARLLDRHPECAVIVGRDRGGCLLVLHGGWTVRMKDPSPGPTVDGPLPWPAICGSTVHCWLSAGLPVGALDGAVVATGRYPMTTVEQNRRFLVTGRTDIKVCQEKSTTAARRAAQGRSR